MKKKNKKEVSSQSKLSKIGKEHVNIVFIGHVDAGKSTIAGQLMYKLNPEIDDRAMEKIKTKAEERGRESWVFAFVMDNCEEEREKGKTVEVARAFFETKTKRYTILDAPGGCSQADIAILVISARRGEFETGFKKQGQTIEHTTIAKTLGIKHLIVAVNKMDEETVKWDEKRYKTIVSELHKFLFKKLGFSKRNVWFIPISGLSGSNILEKVDESVCSWYKKGTFVELLDAIKPFNRNPKGPLRIPIIDKYKDKGCVVILGKVESGSVKKGDSILIMPNNSKGTVIDIFSHNTKINQALPGENIELYVKNVSEQNINTGMVVCDIDHPLYAIQEFLGNFLVLDKDLFAAGYSAMIHVHTAEERVTILSLISKLDKKTGKKEKEKPKYGKTGELLIAKFRFDRPICVEKFEDNKALGRFTIREDKTIAVGKILKIKPLKKKISKK